MRKLILVLLLGCSACTTQAQDPGAAVPKATTSAPGAGAAAQAAPAAPTAPSASPGDTLARIRAMVADATCTESGQCRTLPVGAIACGGPQSYLPYSVARTNEKELRELGERYKAERLAEIKASGLMSTCRYLPDPGAVCTSGSCQLGGGSPAVR